MSSWFGGPSRRDRERSERDRDRDHRRPSMTVVRRDSGTSSVSKGAFVRPRSPGSRSEKRRDSSPKGYFVRPHSPGGRSTTTSRSYRESERRGEERGLFDSGERGGVNKGLFSTVMGAAMGGAAGRHSSSSSYYKRRPRDGYIARLMATIRRLFRNLYHYARRNPVKLFMLVIMPLVTGGALAGILKKMGVRLPDGVGKMMGAEKLGREGAGAGGVGIEQVMGIAKMFI